MSGSVVFLILLLLVRSSLVAASPPEEPNAPHKRLFKITGSGRETLDAARSSNPLEDFA